MKTPPRLLIEEWLPAAAIGVECMRERATGQQPPDKRLHVWWARRPLTVSRAAVLGSVLPADFPREVFERLLGFGRPSEEIVAIRRVMDSGVKVDGGFGYERAFKRQVLERDLEQAHAKALALWGALPSVIDPMAGGGSIPLESARLGLPTLANEYNPVACTVLEATVDYPFRFGPELVERARHWAKVWETRVEERLADFFPKHRLALVHAYIYARTVPCPDTQFPTPLVPDWHLLKPKDGQAVVAEPVVHKAKGTWSIRVREVGGRAGQLREPPPPTYSGGKGISLFTRHLIASDYIKAKAQAGEMGSTLYAIAVKTNKGLEFRPPEKEDLDALAAAEKELAKRRKGWERDNVIPTESRVKGDCDRSYVYGLTEWADMFSPRQLLGFGVLVEELRRLRPEIVKAEGADRGTAVEHLLAFVLDKFVNWNAVLSSWNVKAATARSVFDRHDFSFKSTFCEMAPCTAGVGLAWAGGSVFEAFEELGHLPRASEQRPVDVFLGSATSLPGLGSGSVSAVVVDPPYADNVQYSELADFFYVWLKRTQGHRRPEWFSTYLCEHDEEAVVNVSRHRKDEGRAREAKAEAHTFYQNLMTGVFRECRRILRDDGALTVMFTHKKQEAWEALFESLIRAGFRISATWPVKTEGGHSLHINQKNAAQSTVLLVARKRPPRAGIGYFDAALRDEIRALARKAAVRLQEQGLNPVDQLVGAFGPAMEAFSRYDAVRTDTGEPVAVGRAIDEAAAAVSGWRVEQLAAKGLPGVEAEGRFALLCWDVLGAAEFRFNEAKLLGHAAGMDVDQLVVAGLVDKSGDKIRMLSATERRRGKALRPEEVEEALFGASDLPKKRVRKADVLKVHPSDPSFRTALDGCHALALRYLEAGGGAAGVGSARSLARQQSWGPDSAVAQLLAALVQAAPEALRREKGKKSAAALFPEFRAWHALMKPLFGLEPPDWTEKKVIVPQGSLWGEEVAEGGGEYDEEADEDDELEEE